jgi:molybdopterin synthase catalytic subunit
VSSDSAGGTALFVGTVRSPNEGRTVEHLDYDVWPERVEAELEAIASEALERFGAQRAYVSHRTGRVGVGEPSVVVAVSAGHRAAAFDACRWAIDTLKQRAPIWKREVTDGGDRWVANA